MKRKSVNINLRQKLLQLHNLLYLLDARFTDVLKIWLINFTGIAKAIKPETDSLNFSSNFDSISFLPVAFPEPSSSLRSWNYLSKRKIVFSDLFPSSDVLNVCKLLSEVQVKSKVKFK